MCQRIPSSLKPACSCICRAVSSHRNTPANLPLYGTTALLKMLLAVGNRLRGMTGLFAYRQHDARIAGGLVLPRDVRQRVADDGGAFADLFQTDTNRARFGNDLSHVTTN